MGAGAMMGYGSDARREGAEAVVYMAGCIRGSKMSSSNRYRCWRRRCDLEMYSRCMGALLVRRGAFPKRVKCQQRLPWKRKRRHRLGTPQSSWQHPYGITPMRRCEDKGQRDNYDVAEGDKLRGNWMVGFLVAHRAGQFARIPRRTVRHEKV